VYPGQHNTIISPDVWEAVQALLAANNQAKRTGVYAKDPSLLAGLLFDDRGHRLTPIHTIRRGIRYRYYVSQAILQNQPEQQGRVCRLPAHDIEQQVTRQLEQWLGTESAVLEQLALPSDDMAARATILARTKTWEDLGARAPADLRGLLLVIVRRVTVDETAVHLKLSRSGLRAVLLRGDEIPTTELMPRKHQEDHEDDIPLSANVMLRRGTRGIRLVVPGESATVGTAQPNISLINDVARAHAWYVQLLSGQAKSLQAIARAQGIDKRYAGRILCCAFLARIL
jgi:hypothetical protein